MTDMTVDNAQIVRKTFTVTLDVPFDVDADKDEILSTDKNMAVLDMGHIGMMDTDLVEISDVKAVLLEGEEAQAAVDKFNKVFAKVDTTPPNTDFSDEAEIESMLKKIFGPDLQGIEFVSI
jgi:hypothetical protein